jgi:hypothetical protein
MISGLVGALKNRKTLAGLGLATLLGGYLIGRFFSGDEDEQKINIQLSEEPKQPQQPQKPQAKASGRITVGSKGSGEEVRQEPKQNETVVGAFIPELIKLYQLTNALALQYEQDAEAYYRIYQLYEKKLEELIPIIAVELGKTPLSQMTGADLPSKISTLFKYYSWDFATQNFPKILKGYYLLKMYNQDTTNLTINDLIAVADNPALAQNENVLRIFEQIGELYKLKMQGVLEQLGKLKDVYAYKLNVLKEQANMIKNMINAILDQEELNFRRWAEREKLRLQEKRLAIDSAYKSAKIAQGWEALRLKREQLNQKLSGGMPLIKIADEE